MKISELINEAISFTQHLKDIETVIDNSIKKAISGLTPDKFQNFKNSVTRSKSYQRMLPFIESELETLLQSSLEQNLQNAGIDILSSVDSDYAESLSVEFKDIADNDGQATDFAIDINIKFIDNILEELVPSLEDSALNSIYDEDNIFDDFFEVIKSKQLQTSVLKSWSIQRNIDQIASTFIHELVHVRQHIPQYKKGRDDTEYRSYLDKTKGEFGKMVSNPQDSDELPQRYYDLYVASPQEIAARAHQAAIKVIKDTGLNAINDLEELPSKRDILANINEYAREQFKTPETSKETQVFNRYIKLIYQEVDRYYDNTVQRLKNS